jgi:hypothetical protein
VSRQRQALTSKRTLRITSKPKTNTGSNLRFSRILGRYSHEARPLFAKIGEEQNLEPPELKSDNIEEQISRQTV